MGIGITALLLGLVGAFAFMNPKSIMKKNWSAVKALGGVAAIAGILMLLSVIAVPSAIDLGEFEFGTQTASSADGLVPSNVISCDSSTTPDLDINAFDIDNPNTALTESTNLYRKLGGTGWAAFTAGTAISNLEIGERYEVVMGISTSDVTDNAYGEYFTTGPIDCKELIAVDKGMYNDEIETSLTATFYNRNHDASAEAFIAGEVNTVSAEFIAGTDEVFGNAFIADSSLSNNGNHRTAYPNVVCMNLNSTAWDVPQKVSVDGVEMNRVSTPLRHTLSTTATTFCYEAPVVDSDGIEIDIKLDADDSNAPTADDTLYLYASGFYITEDSDVAWGVEDEDGNAVATDAADTLALDFTA